MKYFYADYRVTKVAQNAIITNKKYDNKYFISFMAKNIGYTATF